jgi:hypothetical protein
MAREKKLRFERLVEVVGKPVRGLSRRLGSK